MGFFNLRSGAEVGCEKNSLTPPRWVAPKRFCLPVGVKVGRYVET